MSSTLQPVDIDGQTVWVEVVDTPVTRPAATRGKFSDTSAQGAAQGAVEAVGRIDFARTLSAVVTPVHQALRSMSPDEVTVELSLGIKGEVGIFIASGEGNASVKISAKWKFDPTTA